MSESTTWLKTLAEEGSSVNITLDDSDLTLFVGNAGDYGDVILTAEEAVRIADELYSFADALALAEQRDETGVVECDPFIIGGAEYENVTITLHELGLCAPGDCAEGC